LTARRVRTLATITTLLATAVWIAGRANAASPPNDHPNRPSKHVCPRQGNETARCHARVVTKADGVTPDATTTPWPGAYTPTDIQSAYGLPGAGPGAGQTIAIVDAFDNPNAESDLAQYRSRFGLPPCTTANGCFKKVNQNGQQGNYPPGNIGWGQEIALDLDAASAVCPSCNLLLVEATTNLVSDLALAADRAAVLGATAISNSYGANEFNSETVYEGRYNHPGVAITASTGDDGYGVQFPAASRYVTAVGGTRLVRDSSKARGWAETAWSGAGSGCSKYIAKPAWQTDAGCTKRTVADVSAVADPSTGFSIYDSYGSGGGANWYIFGGTSLSAPIIAGIYALAANTASLTYGSQPYAHTGALNDVTSGNNGGCGGSYLCTAKVGYDGPTGLGTPQGLGAFGGPDGSPPPTTTTSTTSASTSTTTTTVPPTTTTSTSTSTTSTSTTSTSTTTSTTLPTTTTTSGPPPGAPSAPTNVSAVQSSSPGVLVYWYPPSNYGCGTITGYRIYRSITPGTETPLVTLPAYYTYQDSATTAGVRYYYKVTALNSCGEGPKSAEVTAVAR
jgi:subtilase family serine protease